MNYVLDTNVISELIAKQPYQPVLDWVNAQDQNNLYVTVITIGEIQKGIAMLADSARKATLHQWLTDSLLPRFAGQILVFDTDSSIIWGQLTGRLMQIGKPLAALDSMIAAIAQQHVCTIVTRNDSDFADTGVPVFNPWKLTSTR